MPNRISVRFVISGYECSSEVVTRRLGVEPSKTWNEGDSIAGTKRRHARNGWRLDSTLVDEFSISQQMEDLLGKLPRNINQIHSLPGLIEIDFSCVVYAEEYVPEMFFSTNLLTRVVELGASIDIDFYCMLDD